METLGIPKEFIWRRLHSLMGLWLVLFLLEHLLTNSQAALWLGGDGYGFINMVNALHNFPYLQALELSLIAVPIAIHMVLGIRYALTCKFNAHKTDGSSPCLPYKRNKAYSWQRITSWVLAIGLTFHITTFRFLKYPVSITQGKKAAHFVKLTMDEGLYTLADRLSFRLYDASSIAKQKGTFSSWPSSPWVNSANEVEFDWKKQRLTEREEQKQWKYQQWQALESFSLKPMQVIAETDSFGTATLLTVRDTFKSPYYLAFYTLFVASACFHALHGFWTFLLTWGLVVKRASQRCMLSLTTLIMTLLLFLGFSSIFGSFWLNFRH